MTKTKPAIFGVAGNPPNFWKSKYKSDRINSVEWLHEIGLDAIELQATYGIKMPQDRALLFREKAEKFGICLSLHGPYFINLASKNPEIVARSIQRVLDAFELVGWLGSDRIIFHPGGFSGDRNEAVEKLIANIKIIESRLPSTNITLRAEIGGKVNQLGSLDEIIRICQETNIVKPCIDFAHLHAREFGSLIIQDDFRRVFAKIQQDLGREILNGLHCHFYPVDFNGTGEKSHKKFTDIRKPVPQTSLFEEEDNSKDNKYFPRFEPFIDTFMEFEMNPTVICEARDSQDEGAKMMKNYYLQKVETSTAILKREHQ